MISYIRDVPIHYERHGSGKPILCIHGYAVDHQLMAGCLEPVFTLTNGYQRIYLDLPGMGKTPSASWIHNADDMLTLIIDFIHSVIPDGNFLIVGESYGGYLTLGIIMGLHERVDGVMLICPGVFKNPGEKNPDKETLWRAVSFVSGTASNDDMCFADFFDLAVIANAEIYEKYVNYILSGKKTADRDFLSKYGDGGYWFSFDDDLLSIKFDKPTTILAGRQDHITGYSGALDFLSCFPRATFAVMDCSGHNLQFENEPLFDAHVRDWIWRIGLESDPRYTAGRNSV